MAVTVAVAVAFLNHNGQQVVHSSMPSTMQTGSSSWKEQGFRHSGWSVRHVSCIAPAPLADFLRHMLRCVVTR